MSLLSAGLLMLLIGAILWAASVLPGLGYVLVVVGLILVVVALVTRNRASHL